MLTYFQSLKAKRDEEELEDTRSKLPTFQRELAEHKSQLDKLQGRAQQAEAALLEAKAAFESEKKAWKLEQQQRVDEERQNDGTSFTSHEQNRVQSPVPSMRRGLTSEYLGLQNLQTTTGRRPSSRSMNGETPTSGLRPSIFPLSRSPGSGTPTRQDSMQSLTAPGSGDVPYTPSLMTMEPDELFEGSQYPASPQQTIHDMASVSGAGAGPSVQFVERMSLAVRRLESEKVATKEDLSRLSAQRDEARAEIVRLMREIDEKRAADEKIEKLEEEVRGINERWQTTLEMLGEKSERVGELEGDIEDIKGMYRELVERTVK